MNRREFLSQLTKSTGIVIGISALPQVWSVALSKPLTTDSPLTPIKHEVTLLIQTLVPIPSQFANQNISLYPFVEQMVGSGFAQNKRVVFIDGIRQFAALAKSNSSKSIESLATSVLNEEKLDQSKLMYAVESGQIDDAKLRLPVALIWLRDVSLIGLFSHEAVAPVFTDNLFHAGEYQPCVDNAHKAKTTS